MSYPAGLSHSKMKIMRADSWTAAKPVMSQDAASNGSVGGGQKKHALTKLVLPPSTGMRNGGAAAKIRSQEWGEEGGPEKKILEKANGRIPFLCSLSSEGEKGFKKGGFHGNLANKRHHQNEGDKKKRTAGVVPSSRTYFT